MVARLTADRAQTLDEEWKAVTARHLTRYDTAERDAWLAEENKIAEWHREYRAKYELEQRLAGMESRARAGGHRRDAWAHALPLRIRRWLRRPRCRRVRRRWTTSPASRAS